MTMQASGLLLAGLGAAALAAPAAAQDLPRFDLSGGWSRLSADEVDLDAIVARGTFHLNDHIGAEVEGQFGVSEDSVGPIDVELDSGYGIFGRGDIQVLDTLGLFGRIGYVDVEIDASLPGFSLSESGDGWAAGVGGELFFLGPAGANGVRADYTRYEFDDGDADGFSISFVHRFGR